MGPDKVLNIKVSARRGFFLNFIPDNKHLDKVTFNATNNGGKKGYDLAYIRHFKHLLVV